MRYLPIVGAMAGLLLAGTASADMTIPGFAGMPDPLTDNAPWFFDAARLELTGASDTSWHYYDVPIPIKKLSSTSNLTVAWEHGGGGGGFVLGSAEVRVLAFNPDGTIASLGGWSSAFGTPSQSPNIPAGGSAMLQIRMKADGGFFNTHYISRIFTSGTASL